MRTIREIRNEEVRVTTNNVPRISESGWHVRFAGIDIRLDVPKAEAEEIAGRLRDRIEELMREAVERSEQIASR